MIENIKNIQLFLLDMDGTLYLENEVFKGSREFINLLNEQNKKYIFLTNNSSKSVDKYLNKLNSLGIKASEKNMFTSAQATSIYLKDKKKNARLYVVGTSSLKEELKNQGFEICEYTQEEIDFLVVGFDTELNYKKIQDACYLLNKGVKYIATNPDWVCPMKDNMYIPDCGSICNMLKIATNREPIYIGKPKREMVDIVSKIENTPLDKIAIIGDRLYTDIACGINAGIISICVLTGETKKEDIEKSEYRPTYVVDSINDIYETLKYS